MKDPSNQTHSIPLQRPTSSGLYNDLPLDQIIDLDVEKLSDDELADLQKQLAHEASSPGERRAKVRKTGDKLVGKSKHSHMLDEFA